MAASGARADRPLVGVVVVNWNGAQQTLACLHSLQGLAYPSYRVCLVDNGSTDGSPAAIRGAFPAVQVLALAANRGYAGGCNAGIEAARAVGARYVWLLNNDTVVEPQALEALVAGAQALGQPAILAPKILVASRPDRLWSAGGKLHRWRLEGEHIGLGEEESLHNQAGPVAWASGCALFFDLAVVERVGPFDERYFLYLEDLDWCLRARRVGIPTWYLPEARLWHDVSRTVDGLDRRLVRYYAYRNHYLLAFRHAGPLGRALFAAGLAWTFGKIGLRTLFFPRYRRDAYYHARTRGLVDLLRGRLGKAPFPDGVAGALSGEPG